MNNIFDNFILEFIQEHLRSGIMDGIMTFITHLGEYGALWLTLGVVLLFFKRTRMCGIALLSSVAVVFLVGELGIKNLVQRDRPFVQNEFELLIKAPSGFSFPSGHTGSSFAAATAIFITTKDSKKLYGILAYVLAFLIAFSRVYLYVHFPTDVLAGMVLGTLLSSIVTVILLRLLKDKIFSNNVKG